MAKCPDCGDIAHELIACGFCAEERCADCVLACEGCGAWICGRCARDCRFCVSAYLCPACFGDGETMCRACVKEEK